MEAYLQTILHFEQNDWGRLLPMAQFAYNNAKNASPRQMHFELNYSYHSQVSYKDNVNPTPDPKHQTSYLQS